MYRVEQNRVKQILKEFSKKRILVVGDLMLDHYIWGGVERISPEAPVPVVDVKKEEYRLGGAANVVHNIKTLGAEPIVVGIVGNDRYTEICKNLLLEKGISAEYILTCETRPTTVKTRIVAHNQQIVRVDFEDRQEIDADMSIRVMQTIEAIIPTVDAVILEDYNKGLLTDSIIVEIIKQARLYNKPVTVDPKFKNFFSYRQCTVFKPNFSELQKNMGIGIETEEEFIQTAHTLMERIQSEYLLITRGERGLTIFSRDKKEVVIPTFAREVYDVSGAGDTVISTMTLCLVSGCNIYDSAYIANHAAGAVCGKQGIAPAYPKDIIQSIQQMEMEESNGQ